jgi:predicted ATPase
VERYPIRIAEVSVKGLFGHLNHVLRLREEDRVSIIYGPNGVGKTIVLRLINALFNQSVRNLARLPFEQLTVAFDNKTSLSVVRKQSTSRPSDRGYTLNVRYKAGSSAPREFTIEPSTIRPSPAYVSMIDDYVSGLSRIAPETWLEARTGETLDLEDVLERYGDLLPRVQGDPASATPPWFQEIRQSISVGFIDTERLTRAPLQPTNADLRRRATARLSPERTVLLYAADLKQRIQQTLSEYGTLSQSLDRTFPTRVVEAPPSSDLDMDVLRSDLSDVEEKRAQLVLAGLLAPEQGALGLPLLDNLDDSRRGVLAVYAQDAKEKLGVFDNLLRRIDTFKRIANSRFLHKTINVSTDGLSVVSSTGSKLELEMLSSGEQHELVILYELLFRVQDSSLILIDEPELSFHIAWQREFLNDLEDVANISNFRVLLATHSPQIIGESWGNTIELRYPD